MPDPAAEFTPTDEKSKHHAVWSWYEGGFTRVALAYHSQPEGVLVGEGSLKVNVGTIKDDLPLGPRIEWGTSVTVFSADQTDGYDFPSITRDSTGYCWLTSRYGPVSSPYKYTQVIIRSSLNTDYCASWPTVSRADHPKVDNKTADGQLA